MILHINYISHDLRFQRGLSQKRLKYQAFIASFISVIVTLLIPILHCNYRCCAGSQHASTHSVVHLVVAGNVLVQCAEHDHGHHA